jgi:ABC-type bacteriocin/lantibiotic exporter with double-glycine peptidase domain
MTALPLSAGNSSSQSTPFLLISIWGHLTISRRIQLLVLFLVMIASGVAELISLGAVLPFLALLSDPQWLWQQPLVHLLARKYGISHAEQLFLPVTIAFASAVLISALIRLFNLWFNGRLASAVGSDLSCKAYFSTLCQPYDVHLKRHSGDVISSISTHIPRSVVALTEFLYLITSAVMAICLFTGLLLINWKVALFAGSMFCSAYGLIAISTRKELVRNSQRIATAAKEQIKALQEGLGAIRDVLLDSTQQTYVDIYRRADRPYRMFEAKNKFIVTSPRYAVEALALLMIVLLAAVLNQRQEPAYAVVPLLGALALGAQRLLPALNQVYVGWTSLTSFNPDLACVLEMLNQQVSPQVSVAGPFLLRKSIRLESVCFSYGLEMPKVLNGFDLEISRGERIGLTGCTGSGKSTLVDLLMGLLKPTGGRLLVDGMDLYDPTQPHLLTAWRAGVAHVPQSIYLADSSIAENIAFGVPRHQIDFNRVKMAAEKARVASYIASTPKGYQTFVGERGIRLSGGQRQRIGIARALYKSANLLVLDEATSALDNRTEEEVMQSVYSLGTDVTVIMIAHRLSTLANCTRIIELRTANS